MVYKEVYRHQFCVSICDVMNYSIFALCGSFTLTRAHGPRPKALSMMDKALLVGGVPMGFRKHSFSLLVTL